jgi:hypothetical protein
MNELTDLFIAQGAKDKDCTHKCKGVHSRHMGGNNYFFFKTEIACLVLSPLLITALNEFTSGFSSLILTFKQHSPWNHLY